MSAYAASYNPDEDFAETLAYYIYQPDLVRTLAPDKYNFIKKVVDGYEYVVLVDKQFTFQVFNLEPDLTFPGKIIGVDTEVYKLENGDNRVVATLHLAEEISFHFEMDPAVKEHLIHGLDDIGLTLKHEADIRAFETTHDPQLLR